MSPGGLIRSISSGLFAFLALGAALTFVAASLAPVADGASTLDTLRRYSYPINFLGAIGAGALGARLALAAGAESERSGVMAGIAGPAIVTFILAPLAAAGEEGTTSLFGVTLALLATVAGAWLGAALAARRTGEHP